MSITEVANYHLNFPFLFSMFIQPIDEYSSTYLLTNIIGYLKLGSLIQPLTW